jgi:adenylate kinase family enzyme
VPVLHEQAVIEASVERFAALTDRFDWLSVLYVTTARERRVPTTHSMIKRLVADRRAVDVVCAPNREGVMAHQLNYAIDWVRELRGDFRFGVYNVDSDPGAAGLVYARDRLTASPEAVLQQYAAYPIVPSASRCLQHSVAWQNRWSLQFELGRALGEWRLAGRLGGRIRARLPAPFHYMIGHGLFMSSATWERVGRFVEDEINEDAFLGVTLARLGIVPEPVPFLELAEGPASLRIHVRQQATWFNGPLYAARYARKLLVRMPGYRARTLLAAAQLQMHSVYWLLGPPALLVVAPGALAAGREWGALALWLGLLFGFTAGLNQLAAEGLRRAGYPVGRPERVLPGLAAYALHCAGPLVACGRTLTGRNVMAAKYKTERAAEVRPNGAASGEARDRCSALEDSARRVLVCGNGGSGKTELAARLGARLGAPVLEVDRVRWAHGWARRPTREVRDAVERFVAQPGWVVEDGSLEVFDLLVESADAVVWADPPAIGCAWRALKRSAARTFAPSRAGPGREPLRMVLRHLRWSIRYPTDRRPRHATALSGHRNVIHLTSWSAVRACATSARRAPS